MGGSTEGGVVDERKVGLTDEIPAWAMKNAYI